MNHQDNESTTQNSKRDMPVALSESESAALKIRQDIGQRLTKIRGQGMSQTEFARRFGVHKNTYAAWERGERDVDASALRVLALEGWSPMWVLTGVGDERLNSTVPVDAAVDTALVVGRDDKEADARREGRFQDVASGLRIAEETATQSDSHTVGYDADTLSGAIAAVRAVESALNVELSAKAMGKVVLLACEHMKAGESAAQLVAAITQAVRGSVNESKLQGF